MGAQRMGSMSLLAAAIAALGTLTGFILGRFTKEELAPGKKYFVFVQHALFVAAFAVFLFAFKQSLWHVVVGLTVIFAYLVYTPFRNAWLAQGLLALTFAFAQTTQLAFLSAVACFLHGLPQGSRLTQRKNGMRDSVILGVLFFAIAAVAQYVL